MAEVNWTEPTLNDPDATVNVCEPPCRVFYRKNGGTIVILSVMRGERPFTATPSDEHRFVRVAFRRQS